MVGIKQPGEFGRHIGITSARRDRLDQGRAFGEFSIDALDTIAADPFLDRHCFQQLVEAGVRTVEHEAQRDRVGLQDFTTIAQLGPDGFRALRRQCCRFLRFELTITPDSGPMTLVVAGPTGTREFLEGLFI